jgi:hypothetical protein
MKIDPKILEETLMAGEIVVKNEQNTQNGQPEALPVKSDK